MRSQQPASSVIRDCVLERSGDEIGGLLQFRGRYATLPKFDPELPSQSLDALRVPAVEGVSNSLRYRCTGSSVLPEPAGACTMNEQEGSSALSRCS